MVSLYELKAQWMELLSLMEDEEDPEMIQNTLEGIECEIEEKADNYARIIVSLNSDIDGISKEIARLQDKKRVLENHVAYLKGNLQDAMILTGKEKFKTELFSFGIQKNVPSVVILDETKIPNQYLIAQEPKIDKRAIIEDLKDGMTCDWARLSQTRSLRIR